MGTRTSCARGSTAPSALDARGKLRRRAGAHRSRSPVKHFVGVGGRSLTHRSCHSRAAPVLLRCQRSDRRPPRIRGRSMFHVKPPPFRGRSRRPTGLPASAGDRIRADALARIWRLDAAAHFQVAAASDGWRQERSLAGVEARMRPPRIPSSWA